MLTRLPFIHISFLQSSGAFWDGAQSDIVEQLSLLYGTEPSDFTKGNVDEQPTIKKSVVNRKIFTIFYRLNSI